MRSKSREKERVMRAAYEFFAESIVTFEEFKDALDVATRCDVYVISTRYDS